MRLSIAPFLFALSLAAPAALADTLSCNATGIGPYTTTGYLFEVATQTSGGGGGGGSSSQATTTLTVQIPLDTTFPTINSYALTGKHISQCSLASTGGTLQLTDVVFSDVKLMSGNYYTLYTPGPVVQLGLSFDKLEIRPGS